MLIAVYSSPQHKIIISPDFPDKEMLKLTLVFNNIVDKILFGEEGQEEAHIKRCLTLVTESTELASRFIESKSLLLVTDSSVKNPGKGRLSKLETVVPC